MREEGTAWAGHEGKQSQPRDKPKERAQLSIRGILDEILGEKKDTG